MPAPPDRPCPASGGRGAPGTGRSTFTTASASRMTRSGTRSFTSSPVADFTTSWTPSRCWTLTAVMTEIPAARRSSTSCHRFSFLPPGAFVCASSSTTATSGFLAITASRSISSRIGPLVGSRLPRDDLEVADPGGRLRPAVGLDETDDDVDAPGAHRVRVVEHPVRLADARRLPEVDLQVPALRVAASEPEEGLRGPGDLGGARAAPLDYGAWGGAPDALAAGAGVGVGVGAICGWPSRVSISRFRARTLTRLSP